MNSKKKIPFSNRCSVAQIEIKIAITLSNAHFHYNLHNFLKFLMLIDSCDGNIQKYLTSKKIGRKRDAEIYENGNLKQKSKNDIVSLIFYSIFW